ncbi:uncharacterized protein LOC133930369 isoform X2 [Phragmites australis]|nr:uncharacterized protein LOC133930369 isoform X2 [Phragmites australis]
MEDEEMDKKVQQYGTRAYTSPSSRCRRSATAAPPPSSPTSLSLVCLAVFAFSKMVMLLSGLHGCAGKESLLDPRSDSITRRAASGLKAKPIINIDDGDDVRTEKHLSWMPDEDLR